MKILVVEDEPELMRELSLGFVDEGFLVDEAANLEEGKDRIGMVQYDLVILDLGLPDGNGLELLQLIRKERSETGVLILSAKDSLDDKISGLEIGADDYLTKPFHFAELNARVKSIFRRRALKGETQIAMDNLVIFPGEIKAEIDGIPIDLTRKEFQLLLFLMLNKGKVISKIQIAEHLWGDFADSFDDLDFIYTHVKNLRKKLKVNGAEAKLETVYGLGYKIVLE